MTSTLPPPAGADTAVRAPTRFAEVNGRRLAYRDIGAGTPLVLCNRFRGVLDSWDPAFLDALARHFRVLTFDYSGLGRSTGRATFERSALANDARDLVQALDLGPVVIGGWSLGGTAAQVLLLDHPELVTHAVLIGTGPPGDTGHPIEPAFFERALKPVNDLDDEIVLFFEPESPASREAAVRSHERIAARTADRSPPIPAEVFLPLLKENTSGHAFPDTGRYRERLTASRVPLLVVSGDHDISFPVEAWYELSRRLPTMLHLVVSQGGHGPQHQLPATIAEMIATFVRTTAPSAAAATPTTRTT